MSTEYRPDIDGLRAIAIGLVVVFHFDIFSIGKAGFIGVDVFFVISGFLITGIIARDLAASRFSYPDFLYRRVRRLFPAMLAVLVAYGVFGWFFLLPSKFEELALEAILSQLYVINFYFWQTVNYFGLQAGNVPLLHMWSLAVEEQFYIFFPVFCLLVWRYFPRGPLWLFAIACVLSFGLGLVATPRVPGGAFYLLPTRAWELLLGGVLALATLRRRPSGGVLLAAGPVGLLLIALSLWLYTPLTLIPGWFALFPTVGAALLLVGGFSTRAPVTWLMSMGPMVWIGKISYPLYLVHWPVMIASQEMLFEFTLPWRVAGLALSVVLAWVIWRYVERPVRSGAVLREARSFATAACGMTATLLVVSGVVYSQNGVPGRFAPQVNEVLSIAGDTATTFRDCRPTQSPNSFCKLGDAEATETRLIIGDSHANALAQAIDIWLRREGQAAGFAYQHACAPVLGVGPARCVAQVETALARATADDAIDEVIFVSIWRYATALEFDGAFYGPDTAPAIFERQMALTVEAFAAYDVKVTIIDPLFSTPQRVPETLAKNLAFGWDWPVERSLEEHDTQFAETFQAFGAAERAGARRVSLIEDFCKLGTCRAMLDGEPLFSDSNHLAARHSDAMADILAGQLNGLEVSGP